MDKLEYDIVMDGGPDTELLGCVRDLDFGAAVYMAVAKYPNRDIQLRRGERVIKRHNGEPKPVPVPPNLKNWRFHLIRGTQMEWLGSVDASDETSATQRAIEMFALTDEHPRRLAINLRRGQLAVRSAGTLPPFSASFCITCLCSQMFIDAESFMSPA
jgi:hypothetical protein